MVKFIRKKLKIIILLVLVLGTGFFYYRYKSANQLKVNRSTSTKVKQGDLEESLTISGEIAAEESATLRFQASGRLSWVGVKEGDYVKKYQGIASLDKREVEKNLKKKLLAYMNERWDFEQTHDDYSVRGRELYQVPGLTDEERRILDEAQFDLESSVLDVEIQNLAVEYANLWTPIAGIVTKVDAPFAGTNITPATAEFEIVNPDSVYFSALADETEVTQLKQNMLGTLTLDAYPDKEFAGTIKNISFTPKSGETGTVYEIKFDFKPDNNDFRYRLGMVGDLTFITQKRSKALYLPLKFFKTENGQQYVYRKEDENINKVKVQTGLETDNNLEILKGVKKGDTVFLPE